MCCGRAPSVPPSRGKAICLVARRGAAGRYETMPPPHPKQGAPAAAALSCRIRGRPAGPGREGRPCRQGRMRQPKKETGGRRRAAGRPRPPARRRDNPIPREAQPGVRRPLPGCPACPRGSCARSGLPQNGQGRRAGAERTQSARGACGARICYIQAPPGAKDVKAGPPPLPRMGRYHPRRVAVRRA